MKRMEAVRSAGWQAVVGLSLALMFAAVPATAFAQDPAPAQQEDPLTFKTSTPVNIIIQVIADKTADFEAVWKGIRENLAKSTVAEHATYNASLEKLYKVDQPPIDAGGTKVEVYVLQLDAPVVGISYAPYKTIWEILYKTGDDTILKYEEANALFEKLKGSLLNMQIWKLTKIGG